MNGPLTSKGDLQDGWVSDEDARGREHTGEADGQDFPADGPEQGRQIEPRGVYRGRQIGPVHCTVIAMRSAGAVNNSPGPTETCRGSGWCLWWRWSSSRCRHVVIEVVTWRTRERGAVRSRFSTTPITRAPTQQLQQRKE